MKHCDLDPDCHDQGCHEDPKNCQRVRDMNAGIDRRAHLTDKAKPITYHRIDMANLIAQTRWADDLVTRMHSYAESIGCKTYDGALSDTIECATVEQAKKIEEWWKENTKDCPVAS